MPSRRGIRRRLLEWYRRAARDLPWRRTKDPYRIWVSEVMLQQTRVAAAIPYFERFIAQFPNTATLAAAPEAEVLRLWGGLGYYLRARNLQRAARRIAEAGSFPSRYETILELPGVGEYTAAAVASIAFGLPHAVLDGNVKRVLSRLECRNDGLREIAGDLLDPAAPGDWNQALMELGAAVCLPRAPRCAECPVERYCGASAAGRQDEFPARRLRPATERLSKRLLLVKRRGRILLTEHGGFWELPDSASLAQVAAAKEVGRFRHSILNRNYACTVVLARVAGTPEGFRWAGPEELSQLPLSTMTRKALSLAGRAAAVTR